ncbi:hypothetical protein GYMLUDRAFT_64169 [Collybiopsis luxurians FD-317 M1]|uniref:JmjC domain-containing protein n=1 Tax=Collybiopsis luxurians FD-317 M1 TaxID=944289 RepID=A0A0D0BDH5_9AGAR|nr:hypothetical protein GYMLUDRAFT_64169 [Collybiopsis luxurians FD-317 M1]
MDENLPATFDQLSSQLQPLVSSECKALQRLLSTKTANPTLQAFGNALKTHFNNIMSTNAIWLNLKAPGNILQTKFMPAQWHEFVSPILYLCLFHMLKDPERPLLELGNTWCSLPSEIPSRITSPFHLLMSGSGWPQVIKDLHDDFTLDAAHFPTSDQEFPNQPAILSILNRSGHFLHKSKLDIIQLNLNFTALHMSHLIQMGFLDYPKSWDAFVVQLKQFFSGGNSFPLNLPSHLERDYKQMEWLFPLLIALAITPLILLRPTALYTTSANCKSLLQIALALGPTSEHPSSLQAVEKIMWTKLIEMANGTKTSLDLIKELLNKIPDVESFISIISERDVQFFFPNVPTSAPISSLTQIQVVEEATCTFWLVSQMLQPVSAGKGSPSPTMAQKSHNFPSHDDSLIAPINVDAENDCMSSPGVFPVGITEDMSSSIPSKQVMSPAPTATTNPLVSPTTGTSTDVDVTSGLLADKAYMSAPGMYPVPIMDEIFPHVPPEDDALSVQALVMGSTPAVTPNLEEVLFLPAPTTPADVDIISGLLSGNHSISSPGISPAPLVDEIPPNAPLEDDPLSIQAPFMSPTPAVTPNLDRALFLSATTNPTDINITPNLIAGIDYLSSPGMALMEDMSSHLPFEDSPLNVQAPAMSSTPAADSNRDLSLSPATTITSVDTTLGLLHFMHPLQHTSFAYSFLEAAAGYIDTPASLSNPVTAQDIPSPSAPEDLAQAITRLFDHTSKRRHPAVSYKDNPTAVASSINNLADLFSLTATQDTSSLSAPKHLAQTITESFNQVEDSFNSGPAPQHISKRKCTLSDEGEQITIPPEVRHSTCLSTKAASASAATLSKTLTQKWPKWHTNCASTKFKPHVSSVKPDLEPQMMQPKQPPIYEAETDKPLLLGKEMVFYDYSFKAKKTLTPCGYNEDVLTELESGCNHVLNCANADGQAKNDLPSEEWRPSKANDVQEIDSSDWANHNKYPASLKQALLSQHKVIVVCNAKPYGTLHFNEASLQEDLGALHIERVIHDASLEDQLQASEKSSTLPENQPLDIVQEPDPVHCLGTYRDLLEASKCSDGKILNFLDNPVSPDKIPPPLGIATDLEAEQGENANITHKRWGLAATAWAIHAGHINAIGYATYVSPMTGEKCWIVAVPKRQDDLGEVSAFGEEYTKDLGNCQDWNIYSVLLQCGDTLIMPPCTPHYVITLDHCICLDNAANWVWDFPDLVAAGLLTNTRHLEGLRSLQFIVRYWSSIICNDSDSYMAMVHNAGSQVKEDGSHIIPHLPNFSLLHDVVAFLMLYNLIQLGSILDYCRYLEKYDNNIYDDETHIPFYDMQNYREAKTHAHRLWEWLFQHFLLGLEGEVDDSLSATNCLKAKSNAWLVRQCKVLILHKVEMEDREIAGEHSLVLAKDVKAAMEEDLLLDKDLGFDEHWPEDEVEDVQEWVELWKDEAESYSYAFPAAPDGGVYVPKVL